MENGKKTNKGFFICGFSSYCINPLSYNGTVYYTNNKIKKEIQNDQPQQAQLYIYPLIIENNSNIFINVKNNIYIQQQ